jgi:flagellar M-ring protein FliF
VDRHYLPAIPWIVGRVKTLFTICWVIFAHRSPLRVRGASGVGLGLNNITQFLNRLGLARVAAMGVVAVMLLGFFAFLVMRVSSPSMAPLYTDLSIDDSAAVTKELQTMNVPFDLAGDGSTIMVPRDQVATVRMTLAGDGLPSKGQVGYEIFDQESTLGATSFVQNINNVRALEGELARSIDTLARIKSARVHLVLPGHELFSRQQKDPSASIVLEVRGNVSQGEIRAIQHLVASAVEGLTPDRVAIVDDSGDLLASGSSDGGTTALTSDEDERVITIQDRLETNLENMLNNVLGPGRARVEVTAELNLQRSTSTSQTFDPNNQVVHSTQTKSVANSSSGPGDNGAVTVSNQLPGAAQSANGSTTAPAAGAAGAPSANSTSEQATTNEETTNYDNSVTTLTSTTDAGGIKRLSVAVAVDGTYATDGKGGQTYTPLPAAEVTQLTSLVQSAVGYDKTRGDVVQVVNLQFAQKPAATDAGSTGPGLFDFTRDDLINGAQMLVTLVVALALIFFVMRPLLKKVLTPEQPLALPASAELLPPGAPNPAPGAIEAAEIPADGAAAWVSNAKSMGEQQMRTLKTVGSLVDENPKQAALIVRDWLNNAA